MKWAQYIALGAFVRTNGNGENVTREELIGVLLLKDQDDTEASEWRLRGHWFYAEGLAIGPSWRGFSIASRLFREQGVPWMLEKCSKQKANGLYMQVWHGNFAALSLYLSSGFNI